MNNKRGTKKIFAIISIALILLTISGTFALSSESEDFIKKTNKEIVNKTVTSVKKIDFNSAPSQVNIKNIDKTHLSMYEIDTEEEPDRPLFMITFSEEYIPQEEQSYFARSILSFGISGEINKSMYLQSFAGINADYDNGQVMMRSGSITGISTIMNTISEDDYGKAEIIIYKNKKEIGFRNVLIISSDGIKKDFDTQSKDLVTFMPGDIISVYVRVNGEIVLKDIITNIEITTD